MKTNYFFNYKNTEKYILHQINIIIIIYFYRRHKALKVMLMFSNNNKVFAQSLMTCRRRKTAKKTLWFWEEALGTCCVCIYWRLKMTYSAQIQKLSWAARSLITGNGTKTFPCHCIAVRNYRQRLTRGKQWRSHFLCQPFNLFHQSGSASAICYIWIRVFQQWSC